MKVEEQISAARYLNNHFSVNLKLVLKQINNLIYQLWSGISSEEVAKP